jgi:hypothetical protein
LAGDDQLQACIIGDTLMQPDAAAASEDSPLLVDGPVLPDYNRKFATLQFMWKSTLEQQHTAHKNEGDMFQEQVGTHLSSREELNYELCMCAIVGY